MECIVTSSDDERDGRSASARGYVLANRATAIGMQMALPPALGWWADSKFNTSPWLLCLGAVLGFVASLLQLIQLASDSNDKSSKD